MGYTHYWYRPAKFNAEKFAEFAGDCKRIVDYCEKTLGINLADGVARVGSKPTLNFDEVRFNGSDRQEVGKWTTAESITIPWPSDTASITEEVNDPIANKKAGGWFAGDLVSQRVAPVDNSTGYGSGSYETFAIDQDSKQAEDLQAETGELLHSDGTKTAYRPYDLTVTACLIALKHHFPFVVIRSDGQEKDWADGKFLCNNLLGYGLDFSVDKKRPNEKKPEPKRPNIAPRAEKKITLATIKSYVKKNRNALYIRCESRFSGMSDCVESVNGGFTPVKSASLDEKYTLGIDGAYFVRDSRDYFSAFDDGIFYGYHVSNCCGSFTLAMRRGQ